MAPEEIGDHHTLLQEEIPNPRGSGVELTGFLGLFIPIPPFPHGNLSKLKSLHPPGLTKVICSEFLLKSLGPTWIFQIGTARATRSVRERKQSTMAQSHRSEPMGKLGCRNRLQSNRPPTRGRRFRTWPVATYILVPLTSEQGCANKKGRGSLALFSIHACFENITCLADYMIIILKGCQGTSGIIIIRFAGFRAHGNTLVLGGLL